MKQDQDALLSLRNDVNAQQSLMALPRPNTLERVEGWLSSHLNASDTVFFAIAEKTGDRVCGFIQVVRMHFVHGTGELGICMVPSERGKGYAHEAIMLLETYLLEMFNLRKITLQVLLSNGTAVRLYEKCGYRRVGVYAQHFYNHYAFHDVLLMEKLLPR